MTLMRLDSTLPRPLRLWVMTSEQQLVRLLRLESMQLGGAALPVSKMPRLHFT